MAAYNSRKKQSSGQTQFIKGKLEAMHSEILLLLYFFKSSNFAAFNNYEVLYSFDSGHHG